MIVIMTVMIVIALVIVTDKKRQRREKNILHPRESEKTVKTLSEEVAAINSSESGADSIGPIPNSHENYLFSSASFHRKLLDAPSLMSRRGWIC